MAKRETGLHPKIKSPRSHKTVKRLAIKNEMLAKKATTVKAKRAKK